jgi:hypothetical protein
MRECNLMDDALWTDDHEAATHLRNPVTCAWVEMKPPVPYTALVGRDRDCFWARFAAWCEAAWDLGHCDPSEVKAGPVLASGHGGWQDPESGLGISPARRAREADSGGPEVAG